jgi:hypothetical protein
VSKAIGVEADETTRSEKLRAVLDEIRKGIGSCAASLTRRMAALQERSAANWRGEGDAQRRLGSSGRQ